MCFLRAHLFEQYKNTGLLTVVIKRIPLNLSNLKTVLLIILYTNTVSDSSTHRQRGSTRYITHKVTEQAQIHQPYFTPRMINFIYWTAENEAQLIHDPRTYVRKERPVRDVYNCSLLCDMIYFKKGRCGDIVYCHFVPHPNRWRCNFKSEFVNSLFF